MSSQNKMSMPSGMGGLVRYFDEYKSKVSFSPGTVIVLAIIILVIEVILHTMGPGWLGL
jgi:preprotein translocase subunit Sec61beta